MIRILNVFLKKAKYFFSSTVRKGLDDENAHFSILLYIKHHINVNYEISKIKADKNIDIKINEYFMNSYDYLKLVKKIHLQIDKINNLKKIKDIKQSLITVELEKLIFLQGCESKFKESTLRLAELLCSINSDSSSFSKLKKLFDAGEIMEIDRILLEVNLINDQEMLIAKMTYLKSRNSDLFAILILI